MMEQVLNKALAKASTQGDAQAVARGAVRRSRCPRVRRPQLRLRPPRQGRLTAPPPPPAVQPSQPPSAVAEATPRIAHAITMARVRHVLMGPDLKRQTATADESCSAIACLRGGQRRRSSTGTSSHLTA